MPYSLAQLITATRQLLNESTAGFYTDAEITEWLNQATLDIAAVAKCVEGRVAIGMTLGTWQYTLPTDNAEVLHVVWDDTKQALRKIMPSMVGEAGPDSESDQPATWFEWNGQLYVNPLPTTAAAGKNVEVFYAKTTNNPTLLPDTYQLLAITYATYRGKLKDKRFAEANALYAEYSNSLGFRRIDIQQRQPHTEADVQLAARTVQGAS